MTYNRVVTVKDSSQIKEVAYDVDLAKMAVKFASGDTYVYSGIMPATFGSLISAESVGSFFSSRIRSTYPFVKLGRKNEK